MGRTSTRTGCENSYREGGQARISAQLIRVSDQTHLWAQNYQRELHDLLQLQPQRRLVFGRLFIKEERRQPGKRTLSFLWRR